MNGRKPSRRRAGQVAMGLVLVAVAVTGFALGYFLRPGTGTGSPEPTSGSAAPERKSVWTCSMHPQVRLPEAGSCPICSMPLIPAEAGPASGEAPTLTLGPAALAMASVETAQATRRKLSRELRLLGKVQYNETALATVTSRIDGYIERLFVDYTGVQVAKGDHLVEIYSPDLVVAQTELLLAAGGQSSERLFEAGRAKLVRWGITRPQIDELLRTRKVTDRMTIYSPVKGTVLEKSVVEKSSVKAGDVLYRLVSLDVYEFELGSVRQGQPVELSSEAYPELRFSGIVTFVSPVVDEESRTVKVRVNVANPGHALKPGMFVSAVVRARLLADGTPGPTGLEGKYTCPMHPEVLRDAAGPCPICGMPTEQIPGSAPAVKDGPASPELVLTVPRTAVLDSGTRQLVYVERAKGQFESVEIRTGPRAGEHVPVLAGLKEGDKVAIRGAFLLDSQFQIQGMKSLLEPGPAAGPAEAGEAGSAGSAGSAGDRHEPAR